MTHQPQTDDRDYYVVKCRFGREVVAVETDDHLTLEQVVEFIRSGEFTRVVQVVQYNTGHGTSRDVTEDVARDVANIPAGSVICKSAMEFIERHASPGLANEVRLVAEVA